MSAPGQKLPFKDRPLSIRGQFVIGLIGGIISCIGLWYTWRGIELLLFIIGLIGIGYVLVKKRLAISQGAIGLGMFIAFDTTYVILLLLSLLR